MCRNAREGRFCWNREKDSGHPLPKAFCCSDRRKWWGQPLLLDENLGLDPAAVAPEKRLRSRRWKKNDFGPFFDVVVRRMLSSTCQMVKRERCEDMTSDRTRGNGATKFPRATPLSRDPPVASCQRVSTTGPLLPIL